MNIKITPNVLRGTVTVPQSKSLCHRALICAALADKPVRLNITELPYDVEKTIDALRAFGANISIYEDHIDVVPPIDTPSKVIFDCGGSGSALRFAIPLYASLGIDAEFKSTSSLSIDHIGTLIESLTHHGCKFSGTTLPLKMTGKIKNGDYYIPASESSQFTSSLLMSLARTEGESRMTLLPPVNSKRYVDLTVGVLTKFGSKIDILKDGYIIHGKPFVAPNEFTPEPDYAAASVWLGAGVTVKGLPEKTLQADETVIEVLISMGALIYNKDDELHCDTNNLHAFCLHASQFPDIVPSLCAVAATAKGTSHITGIEKLRYRDTDRLEGLCELINALGGKAKAFENDIIIEGVSRLKGGEVDCRGDHRLVFAAAIMSGKCDSPIIIKEAECVYKSYRRFWDDFVSVGGIVEEI